jgi:hypothetical protein
VESGSGLEGLVLRRSWRWTRPLANSEANVHGARVVKRSMARQRPFLSLMGGEMAEDDPSWSFTAGAAKQTSDILCGNFPRLPS